MLHGARPPCGAQGARRFALPPPSTAGANQALFVIERHLETAGSAQLLPPTVRGCGGGGGGGGGGEGNGSDGGAPPSTSRADCWYRNRHRTFRRTGYTLRNSGDDGPQNRRVGGARRRRAAHRPRPPR